MTGSAPVEETSGGRVGVIIAGAGSGRRLGGASKPFLELAGKPVLEHALAPFLAEPRVVAIAVALSERKAENAPRWLAKLTPLVRVVAGGAERADSVRAAFDALPSDLDVIAVHDAARPLVTQETVTECIERALEGSGAVAGRPVVDSLKRTDARGRVLCSEDRRNLWHAHTPQCFPAAFLRKAYEEGRAWGGAATDEASLLAPLGFPLVMVSEGSPNPKITHPADVELAEAVLAGRRR